MPELKNRTLKGLFWSSLDTYGVYLIKIVFSIAVARLLNPEDYGLVGMIAIFIAFGSLFVDGGFQDALIQKKNPTDIDFSSVFYFKITIAIIFYLVLFINSGAIANFYSEPRVIPIIKVMGLTFVISAFGSIHVAWFTKRMDFKIFAVIRNSSSLFSGIVAVTTAYFGFGVWALVLQTLTATFLNTLLYWIFNKWRPKLFFSLNSMKNLFSFGWKMFVQRILSTLFSNIYYLIIGKYFSVDVLGYYTRARKFQEIAVLQTSVAINKVLFPAFSSIQDEQQKFSSGVKKSFGLLTLFIFPLVTTLIVTTKPFVIFFLTVKWIDLIPYMQLLYLSGFIIPFNIFNNSMINALGRSDISLKINLITKLFVIVSIIVGIYFGIFGLIIAGVISSIFTYLLSAKVCGDKIGFSLKMQIQTLLPLMFIALFAFLAGYLVLTQLTINYLALIFLQILVIFIVFYGLARGLKIKAYLEFKKIFQNKLPKKYQFIL